MKETYRNLLSAACILSLAFLLSPVFAQIESDTRSLTNQQASQTENMTLSEDYQSTTISGESPGQVHRFGDLEGLCRNDENVYDCVETYVIVIKKSPDFFGNILAYAAVREDDITLCDGLNEKQEICREDYEGLILYRKLGGNNCESLSGETKEHCKIMNRDCEEIRGHDGWEWMLDSCQGYVEGNLMLIKRGEEKDCEKSGNCNWTEEGLRESLSVFQGYKHNKSKKSCEQFILGLDGPQAFICEVLFSGLEINKVLDVVAENLAFFLLAEFRQSDNLCNDIKNAKLKAGCLSGDRKKYFTEKFQRMQ